MNDQRSARDSQTPERRIVVLGSGGMLGRALCAECANRGVNFEGLSHAQLDITDLSGLEPKLDASTTLVNCAAWTDVDGAEQHRDQAFAVNGQAVEGLVRACHRRGASLVHFSTDYVFDGFGRLPYPTDAPTAPLNAYGASKLAGERALNAAECPVLLLRTSWLYAPWGKNFLRTIARRSAELGELRVVDDQWGRPTSARQLARVTLELIEAGQRGVFHVTDAGEPCTWYDFAQHIVTVLERRCRVVPCDSSAYPTPARRPAYSVLDLSKTEAIVRLEPWREEVRRVCDQLPNESLLD